MQDGDLFLLYLAGKCERLRGDEVVKIAGRDVCWLEYRGRSGFASPKI